MKQYIVDIKGVIIPEDEWDNTSIYRVDIDDDKIKIMKDYRIAYEHNI